MAGRGTGPDFVEALARGLDVLTAFGPAHRTMSLSEVAETTGLARPTARRRARMRRRSSAASAVVGAHLLRRAEPSQPSRQRI